MRVALADRDCVVAESLSRLIDAEPDMTVTGVYSDGHRLLYGLRDRPADVVLLDPAGLTSMGNKLIWKLRASYPSTHIVVLTTSRRAQHLSSAVRAGVRGYLSKSVTVAELLHSLRAVGRGLGALGPHEAAELMDAYSREADEQTGLTARQQDLLSGMVRGKSYRQIAQELGLTEKTVKNYTRGLFSSLGVNNRSDAVVRAFQMDLVSQRDWFPEGEMDEVDDQASALLRYSARA
jgi:DNA-binding NarL/FixJ family response regulator